MTQYYRVTLQHGAQRGLDAAAALGLADGLHAALHPVGRLLLSCSLPGLHQSEHGIDTADQSQLSIHLLPLPLRSLSTFLTPALSCWGVLTSPSPISCWGLLT